MYSCVLDKEENFFLFFSFFVCDQCVIYTNCRVKNITPSIIRIPNTIYIRYDYKLLFIVVIPAGRP